MAGLFVCLICDALFRFELCWIASFYEFESHDCANNGWFLDKREKFLRTQFQVAVFMVLLINWFLETCYVLIGYTHFFLFQLLWNLKCKQLLHFHCFSSICLCNLLTTALANPWLVIPSKKTLKLYLPWTGFRATLLVTGYYSNLCLFNEYLALTLIRHLRSRKRIVLQTVPSCLYTNHNN